MKMLFVIRHAKSDQRFLGNDFDRPLNNRGHESAPLMANTLKEKNIKPDVLISSPALRAKTTAQYFAKTFNITEEDIVHKAALYHAQMNTFYETIAQTNDAYHIAFVFSHNPGITDFVNSLSDAKIDDMPTCAIFGVSFNIDSWQKIKPNIAAFHYFDYPKNHQ
jgi:phosphohistidine phosphatase